MKVDKGVSTWRIWGLYIQFLKELTFPRVRPLATIAPSQKLHPNPRHEPNGHINNQIQVLVNILYLIFNI